MKFLLSFRMLAVVSMLVASFAWAVEEAYQFDNEAQRQLFKELAQELRCPKCQNQNIADSNALVSKDMKDKVFELLKQGYNREQVINYMVDRYGYFVHYEPPKTAATSVLWIGPLILVVAGFAGVFAMSRRKQIPEVDESDAEKLLEELEQDKDKET